MELEAAIHRLYVVPDFSEAGSRRQGLRQNFTKFYISAFKWDDDLVSSKQAVAGAMGQAGAGGAQQTEEQYDE